MKKVKRVSVKIKNDSLNNEPFYNKKKHPVESPVSQKKAKHIKSRSTSKSLTRTVSEMRLKQNLLSTMEINSG